MDEWAKELAPSTELRKWFNHKAELFTEFVQKYREELKLQHETLQRIKKKAAKQQICLLYSAKDKVHNQAVVLKSVLESL